jgi:hypothetical protein
MSGLIEFIKKNIGPSLTPKKMSGPSKSLINKIADQILLGQESWRSKTKYEEYILGGDEFPKGVDFEYIDPEIREEIKGFSKIGKKYSFVVGDRTIFVYAVYPYSGTINRTSIYKLLDESVKKMYIWLYAGSHFAPTECSRELTVYWYLTNAKKVLPELDREPIGALHANTAFTFACSQTPNNIYIYRKEEWFKVFIHESFHSLGLDFAKMPEEIANTEVFKIFKISCDLRFYEAYTEAWAEIINVLFICMENPGFVFEILMNNERMFSLFQKTKILDHQKIKYRSLLSKNNYREETPIFSYYILKSIMIFFYDDFIEWCIENNGGSVSFNKTPENIKSLVSFIKERFENPEYLKYIDEFERWFSSNGHKESVEMETLRMSISDA